MTSRRVIVVEQRTNTLCTRASHEVAPRNACQRKLSKSLRSAFVKPHGMNADVLQCRGVTEIVKVHKVRDTVRALEPDGFVTRPRDDRVNLQ